MLFPAHLMTRVSGSSETFFGTLLLAGLSTQVPERSGVVGCCATASDDVTVKTVAAKMMNRVTRGDIARIVLRSRQSTNARPHGSPDVLIDAAESRPPVRSSPCSAVAFTQTLSSAAT